MTEHTVHEVGAENWEWSCCLWRTPGLGHLGRVPQVDKREDITGQLLPRPCEDGDSILDFSVLPLVPGTGPCTLQELVICITVDHVRRG